MGVASAMVVSMLVRFVVVVVSVSTAAVDIFESSERLGVVMVVRVI